MNARGLSVWLVQIGEPLPTSADGVRMRTGALAETLVDRGHRLLWFTSAFDHFTKQWLRPRSGRFTLPAAGECLAIRGAGYRRNVSFRRFWDHRLIAWKWPALARGLPTPDIIVASMPTPDLAWKAVRYARSRQIPSILDVRDPWPDVLIDAVPAPLRAVARGVLAGDFRAQRRAAREATSVVAVTHELLQWEYRCSGRRPRDVDRVIYTGHREKTPSTNEGSAHDGLDAILGRIQGKFVVAFVGTFAHFHAPWVVLEAAVKLSPEIHYVLAGDGQEHESMRAAAARFPNVHFPGWLPSGATERLLRNAHVGICPTDRTALVFPNKAFAYLAAGLPIVSQFEGDLRHFITRREIGLHADPGARATFVAHLDRMAKDREFASRCGSNGRHLFEAEFDARRTIRDFADHVESVAAGH